MVQRAHIDKSVYEIRIENFKKRISELYEPETVDELEADINLLTIRYKRLKKQCDNEKKKSEEIQLLNSKYKDKIKYLLIELEKSQKKWKEMNTAIKTFQDTVMRIRYSSIPVVIAPHNLTLGGGCEMCLHADKVVAHAES